MNTEKLIEKGVKKHFNGQEVLFEVNSLEDQFKGVKYHKSDIIYLEEGELVNGYLKSKDIDLEDAKPKEVKIKENKEAVGELKANAKTTETPIEEVDAFIKGENAKLGIISGTDENAAELAKVDAEIPGKAIEQIEVIVTEELISENKELQGQVVVGETVLVDAKEEIPAKLAETPIVPKDAIAPKKTRKKAEKK